MIASTRTASDIEQGTEAYYAAEAALEMAVLANKGQEPGFQADVKCSETSGSVSCVDSAGNSADGINYFNNPDPDLNNGSYANWKVQGRTRCLWSDSDPNSACEEDSEYYIPYPGSGTAGTNCDPLGEYPDADHPCNWGKIHVGENAAIPLYITNSDGNVTSPWDTEYGLSNIKLRVRTPCTASTGSYDRFPCTMDGTETGNSERYVLDQEDDASIYDNEGDTLLSWQISGNCDVDTDGNGIFDGTGDYKEGCTMLPEDRFDDNTGERLITNSEIYEKLINDATDNLNYHFEVLDSSRANGNQGLDMNGVYGYITDFITNENQCTTLCNSAPVSTEKNWTNRRINKPVLKLSLVHSLKDSDGDPIPYLEYQVVLDVDTAVPADMYQTIIGEGYSGNFKQSVEVKKGMKTGVLNFVIQN